MEVSIPALSYLDSESRLWCTIPGARGAMRIIVGHTNMDLDCMGSLVLARRLFPDYRAVASKLIHPVARNLYNLYKYSLNLMSLEELDGQPVEHVVVVDTRSYGRVKEYFDAINHPPTAIDVFDHHPDDASDIPDAVIHEGKAGANTTLLGLEAMRRGICLTPEEATIALTGIYADTGNFSHENVTVEDFSVAGYLAGQKASIALVRTFLQTLKGESQITLFHSLLNHLTYQTFHGHFIITSYMELERQMGGLAAVVEKVFEVESPDAIFCVFYFARENDALIIARSRKGVIDLARILATFGGGGHSQASSALVKNIPGRKTFHALQAYLNAALAPAVTAESLMSRDVVTIGDSWTLKDASLLLEKIDRTGAPVVNTAGELCGFLSLRDIMKGRRVNQMASPVRSFMIRNVVTGSRETTLREIEGIFFSHTIYYLPIVEDGRVIGLVTRTEYLKARAGESNSHPSDSQ
jgi:tRNA nucleotidyltransferase (CCA-adding enzyme)